MESYLMLLSKIPRVFMILLFKVVHIPARGHFFCNAKNGRVTGAYPVLLLLFSSTSWSVKILTKSNILQIGLT